MSTRLKLALAAMLLLIFAAPAKAQFTSVTATVRDQSNNPYTNCYYSVDFVNRSSLSQLPLLFGSVFQTSYGGASCDSAGNLSITLPDNNQITPNDVPSNWKFTICDNARKTCFTAQLLITGASQNISAALQAASVPFPGTLFGNVTLAGVNGTINAAQALGTDIGAKINNACATFAAGTRVLVPPGAYTVVTEIQPPSNCEIYGPGATLNGDGLVHRIFHINGTSGAHITNVRIHDLAMTNGTPTSGGTVGMDGIAIDFCDKCEIWNMQLTSIQGQWGIRVSNSFDIRIHDNRLFNYSFEGIAGINTATDTRGNSNLWIERNTVDTCPFSGGGNCYGISCTGFLAFPLTAPLTQHCFVLHNVVRNVTHWECYDSHGGNDQWFVDNWGENCFFGIQAGAPNDLTATNPFGVMDGLHIIGNHLDRGTGDPNGYGIVLAGDDISSKTTNANIVYNEIKNYGATNTSSGASVGAITLFLADKVLIQGNKIPTFNQAAIVFFGGVSNVRVLDNIAGDVLSAQAPGATALLSIQQHGAWNIYFDGNTLQPTQAAFASTALLKNGFKASSVRVGPNNKATMIGSGFSAIDGASQFVEYGIPVNFVSNGQTTVVGPLNYMNGDVGYDVNNKPAYVFQGPSIGNSSPDVNQGFWSFDNTTVIGTGTISLSTPKTVTLVSSAVCGGSPGPTTAFCFPIGMNIAIAGAGPAAGVLNARVVGQACFGGSGSAGCTNSSGSTYTLTLDTAASTAVTGANMTWRNGSAPQPIGIGLEALGVQLMPCGSSQGCSWFSGNNSEIGFAFSTDAPFLVTNAKQDQFGADHWTQVNSGNYSVLIEPITSNTAANAGFALYTAAPGHAAGTFAAFWTLQGSIDATGKISVNSLAFNTGTTLLMSGAPTIAGNGCGGSGASILGHNGPASFTVGVGTTPGNTCTVTLPAASNDWACPGVVDITTGTSSVFLQKQGSTSATVVTFINLNSAAALTNFVANDQLVISCFPR